MCVHCKTLNFAFETFYNKMLGVGERTGGKKLETRNTGVTILRNFNVKGGKRSGSRLKEVCFHPSPKDGGNRIIY